MTKKRDITNESERAFAMVDRYITNEKDRVDLKNSLTLPLMQLLNRLQTEIEIDVEDRVISIVMKKMQEIHLADNDELCKNISEIIAAQNRKMFDSFGLMEKSIDSINGSLGKISTAIDAINKRLDGITEVTDEHTLIIKRLVQTQTWWNIGLRIAIAVAISIICFLFIHYNFLR